MSVQPFCVRIEPDFVGAAKPVGYHPNAGIVQHGNVAVGGFCIQLGGPDGTVAFGQDALRALQVVAEVLNRLPVDLPAA